MSVLIAYKRDDTIYMGTDTRVTVHDHKKNELCECNYKIQKLENGMLVGITAERLTRQTIFAYSEIFTLDKNGELTRKHIIKEIIPKLVAILNEEELMIKKEDALPYMDGQILLAYKGVLYEICRNFSIYKYEDFQLLGYGVDYGQFVLANTKDTDDVNERIIKTLDTIAKYSHQVGSPYLLIDTKEQEYKLIRRTNV